MTSLRTSAWEANGNGAIIVLACERMDVRTYSHVTTKNFEIDGLPKFLRYGALKMDNLYL